MLIALVVLIVLILLFGAAAVRGWLRQGIILFDFGVLALFALGTVRAMGVSIGEAAIALLGFALLIVGGLLYAAWPEIERERQERRRQERRARRKERKRLKKLESGSTPRA